MTLFQKLLHSPRFSQVDPLGDGLAEEITAEQVDPASLAFQDELDGDALAASWQQAVDELHQDPDWFKFTDE